MEKILWSPTEKHLNDSQMAQFINVVNQSYKQSLSSYHELHEWSIKNPDEFWKILWAYLKIISSKHYTKVRESISMPGTKWFTDARLNYAENCLQFRDDHTAIINVTETGKTHETSYRELYEKVSKMIQYLQKIQIQKGDRVAAITTNCEETIVVFLAVSAIGAIWTSCSPDFGEEAILSRFSQVEPKCLVFVDEYTYKGKSFNLDERIKHIQKSLPSIKSMIRLDARCEDRSYNNTKLYSSIQDEFSSQDIYFEQCPFDHPLYILYSSGTTGKPKSIVHSAGGALLEHLKEQKLHCDLRRHDVFFYYTSCSWMMWNWLVSGLATGATLVVFDGAPFYPNKMATWKLIEDYNITLFGTSAKYINASLKFGLTSKQNVDMSSLRMILSTGSPLYEEDFDHIYEDIKSDVQLCSISGGTDIVGCFALGNPIMPVYRGLLQSVSLGLDVRAYDDNGQPIKNEKGELVCEAPCPSMPIFFWNDANNVLYQKSYFSKFKNKWHHSDYIIINENGSVKILGRSDSTLNRAGIRIGTSEIYRVVEGIQGIEDSVVIHLEREDRMLLFVKCKNSEYYTPELKSTIKSTIKNQLTSRHSPNLIYQVTDIPYTKSGKKVEVAIKQLFNHEDNKINTSGLANPESLNMFKEIRDKTTKAPIS